MSRFCVSCGAANTNTAVKCQRCGKTLDSSEPSRESLVSRIMEPGKLVEKDKHLLQTGTLLEGRYRIKRVIGEGGFGITYEAVNEKIDMTVAIKEFYYKDCICRDVNKSNQIHITYAAKQEEFERAKNRFLREAKTLSSFHNESAIVKILDYFEENGTAYIVMNYLYGVPLSQYLSQRGTMNWKEMLQKIKPLVVTLERVHNRGVLHRDISANNIMVLENGDLCLLDFGAAKDMFTRGNKDTSTIFTTQGYTPIEQYAQTGEMGAWSDVYALSVVCYQCLTGECPPDSLQRAIFDEYKTVGEKGKNIPTDLEEVLKKGLAVKAENRYANMKELEEAMNGIRERSLKKNGRERKKRKKLVLGAILLAILLVVGIIAYLYREEIRCELRESPICFAYV